MFNFDNATEEPINDYDIDWPEQIKDLDNAPIPPTSFSFDNATEDPLPTSQREWLSKWRTKYRDIILEHDLTAKGEIELKELILTKYSIEYIKSLKTYTRRKW